MVKSDRKVNRVVCERYHLSMSGHIHGCGQSLAGHHLAMYADGVTRNKPSRTALVSLAGLVFILGIWFVNCAKPLQQSDTFDPCQRLREINPHCGWTPHWEDSGISTNAIDGTKTEHLSIESTDADGMDFGHLHYAEIRICFENGKLCGGKHIGVAVSVHGMVEPLGYEQEYSTPVRLKFDNERAERQTWGIADSHDALFPHGREKQFLAQLVQHNKLVLEFSYYEKAARTVTFEISGLTDKMKAVNLFVEPAKTEKHVNRQVSNETESGDPFDPCSRLPAGANGCEEGKAVVKGK